MTFTVTYRGADGAPVTDAVEAASRADCLVQMKARGIAPTSVKDGNFVSRRERRNGGKGGRDGARPSRASGGNRQPSKLKGQRGALWVALAAFAVVVGIWWWMGRDKAQPSPEPEMPKKAALAKEVKPAAAPKPEQATNAVPLTKVQNRNAAPNVGQPEIAPLQGEETNETAQAQDGRRDGGQVFHSGTEQLMGWIFTCPVGKMPPMLPMVPPEELARIGEILDSPNIAHDEDSESVAQLKETVEYAKKELKAFLDEGGRVEDFLKHYHGLLVKAHREREEARMAVEEVERTNPEIAGQFKEKVNGMLRKDGVDELEKDEDEAADGQSADYD